MRPNVKRDTNDFLAAKALEEYEAVAREEANAAMWIIVYGLIIVAAVVVSGFVMLAWGTGVR